jgi:prepilin-type N-terminal cleavage/methylation domain-containing protein
MNLFVANHIQRRISMRLFSRAKTGALHTLNQCVPDSKVGIGVDGKGGKDGTGGASEGAILSTSLAQAHTDAGHSLPLRRRLKGQEGFSLLEVSIALGVIAIMGAVLINQFSSNSTKGQRLYSDMNTLTFATVLGSGDMGGVPSNLSVLWTQANAIPANMFNGITATNSWHGPYVLPQIVDASNNVLDKAVDDGVAINISREAASASNGGNYNWVYYLRASTVPNEIISEAMKKCTGVNILTSTAPTFANSNCRASLGTGSTGTGTFDVKISDSY